VRVQREQRSLCECAVTLLRHPRVLPSEGANDHCEDESWTWVWVDVHHMYLLDSIRQGELGGLSRIGSEG
jgi:hypothetical protein